MDDYDYSIWLCVLFDKLRVEDDALRFYKAKCISFPLQRPKLPKSQTWAEKHLAQIPILLFVLLDMLPK